MTINRLVRSRMPLYVGDRGSSLLNGLVAYWSLDEASGTRYDRHDSNHLTDNNTVTQAVGKVGDAGQFTRANGEYLSLADNAAMSTGDIDFTFCAWLYSDSALTNDRDVLGKWDTTGNQREYILVYNFATARFEFYVSSTGANTVVVAASNYGALPVTTWAFVVIWHDSVANTINVQVNNGTANSTSHTLGVFNGTSSFNIARRGSLASYWDGRLDAVGFWKRVLTADEKTRLYNAGNGLAYPFLGG